MPASLAAARAREFPWADRAIYMNAASFGPLPERSRAAVEAFNLRRQEAYRLAETDIVDALARARDALARLIGATPAEIALGPNTSFGLNLAASFLRRDAARHPRGRVVVLSDREFPANVHPWLALERDGYVVERIAADELGRPREDVILERLQRPGVAAFALSAVQFASGYRADLERFGRLCRDRGILFIVDAIQALGAVPLDVRATPIDILACGGHKWLCGPFGTGFVFAREGLLADLEPPFPGWLSFTSSADFSRLLDYDRELLPDARRFEVGGIAAQDFLGLAHSVELLLELGIDRIAHHVRRVQQPLLDWARSRPDVCILSDLAEQRRSAILCIRTAAPEAVHQRLAAAGVCCSLRGSAIRLAPHFYNTAAEMQRVAALLDEAVPAGRT